MTSKDVIQDVVDDWGGVIQKENVIHRDLADSLAKSIFMEEVTVLTGVRRSGKTFMLYELLKKNGGTYINFEDERLFDFTVHDFEKLFDIANLNTNKILYLDEVQEVIGWEKFAHRVHRRIKLFVTGSNSLLLSSDYSKGLVGRIKSFASYPLTYSEFLRFKKVTNKRESFLEYMKTGGFPRIVLSADTGLAREYLDRIIYRDIVAKNDIRNPEAIRMIANYLLSNVGKEFSFRSLKQISGLHHETTIREYVTHLHNAFLLDTIKAYSGSLKKQESYAKKVYAVDPAFIALGKRREADFGRILENIIFNHLHLLGDIFFVKNAHEVDFLLCNGLKPIKAINSAFEAVEESTISREIKGLLKVMKKFNIPAELVSVYPIKDLPEDIENRLAHQYLKGSPPVC